MISTTIEKNAHASVFILLFYLGLFTAAEWLTAFVQPALGLLLYATLLVIIIIHASQINDETFRGAVLVLVLIPLIRLVSLVTPLGSLPIIYWYPLIGIPILAAAFSAASANSFSVRQLGFTRKHLLLQGLFSIVGIAIGYVQYTILQPEPVATTPLTIIMAAVILIVFAGFVEEFAYRAVIQNAILQKMPRRGVLYSALLSSLLYLDYRSWPVFGMAFVVALLFGFFVQKTGSIWGVTLAHGFINITVYLLCPLLIAHYAFPH